MSHYEKALQAANARIAAAAQAVGRDRNGVKLLAVSKTFPADAIRSVYALGQQAFGENYVQEAIEKQRALADLRDIEWHLIGPLQSNKARLAAESFDWIETVDRLKIAERLAAARPAERGPLNVLIQVNPSFESTKSGVAPADALALGSPRSPVVRGGRRPSSGGHCPVAGRSIAPEREACRPTPPPVRARCEFQSHRHW